MQKRSAFVFLTLLNLSISAHAETTFFSFGGGASPDSSQVVLEKNMELFAEGVTRVGGEQNRSYRLFGGGSAEDILDVYETAQMGKCDKYFGTFFSGKIDRDCTWRHNRLAGLNGKSSSADVQSILLRMSNELDSQDSVRIYYTGHGGRGDKAAKFTQNTLNLWNGDMTVQKFSEHLQLLPKDVATQVVMVQCFSGGFAQMIYEDGILGGDYSKANQCGFFSQIPSRPAAGCTPDINKRQEYSPFFFAALSGKNEKGESVDADYDHDGKVTSTEAHAYVIINERSIDIPVTTSSQLLRALPIEVSGAELVVSYSALVARLDAAQKAILDSLAKALNLDLSNEKDVRAVLVKTLQHYEAQELKAEKIFGEKTDALDTIWEEIGFYLKERYPIFYSSYGVTHGQRLVVDPELAARAKATFEAHPKYQDFASAFELNDQAEALYERAERESALVSRLIYLVDTVLIETKLLKPYGGESSGQLNVKVGIIDKRQPKAS